MIGDLWSSRWSLSVQLFIIDSSVSFTVCVLRKHVTITWFRNLRGYMLTIFNQVRTVRLFGFFADFFHFLKEKYLFCFLKYFNDGRFKSDRIS